jgi:hypothetical protein
MHHDGGGGVAQRRHVQATGSDKDDIRAFPMLTRSYNVRGLRAAQVCQRGVLLLALVLYSNSNA